MYSIFASCLGQSVGPLHPGERKQDWSKAIEYGLELIQTQVLFRSLDLIEVCLELVKTRMDLFMLCQELQLFSKCRNPLCKNGENMSFL